MDTKKLRQKILDLAIHGKLVPQDPNDEPASVLLERIRAEKECLIKEGKIKRSKKSASDTPHYENVPHSWAICNLADVCYFESGYAFSSDDYSQCGTPLVRISNIIDSRISLESCVYINSECDKRFHVKKGDLLIAMSGATTGKMGIYDSDETAFLNQRVGNIKVLNENVLLNDYRNIFMRSQIDNILELAYGGAQPNISANIICSLSIPIPSIEEQKRIIKAVGKWFSLIDTLESAKEDLQASISQAKSKILNLAIHGKLVPQDPNDEPAIELLKRINPKFTPCDNAHCLYGFPISWELAKLEDVCEFIRNGVSIRQIKGANGIPITRIETISNGVVEREKMGYADIEDDTYERYYLQNGDILMSHINSPIHVGKSALYESIDGEKIIHGMNLLCLRMKDGIYPKYMNHLFKSDFFRDKIRPYIKNAVNQASINTRSLGGVYTPIPSHKEQLRIVAKIEELFAVLDEIQKSIEV